jgi:hypothetical protein
MEGEIASLGLVGRSPSVPLTVQDLRAVASVRFAKQFNKRIALIVIPALVIAIAGVAFHKGDTFDVGLLLVVLAMVGFMLGVWTTSRWSKRVTSEFVKEHDGIFWKKEV